MRRQAGFEVTDRIRVFFSGSPRVVDAVHEHSEWIRNETLAVELEDARQPKGELVSNFDINTEHLVVGVCRVR